MSKMFLVYLFTVIAFINVQVMLSQANTSKSNHIAKKDSSATFVYENTNCEGRTFYHGLTCKYSIEVDTIFIEPNGIDNLSLVVDSLRTCINTIRYPDIALRAGVEGNITIDVRFKKDSYLQSVTIVRSDAELFNDIVVNSLQSVKFVSPIKNGKSTPLSIALRVKFWSNCRYY